MVQDRNKSSAGRGQVVLRVLDPTGVTIKKLEKLAPRLDTLESKRVGLVWNRKPKSDVLLRMVGELLLKRFPSVKLVPITVSSFSTAPEAGELEALASSIDAVVYAGAD